MGGRGATYGSGKNVLKKGNSIQKFSGGYRAEGISKKTQKFHKEVLLKNFDVENVSNKYLAVKSINSSGDKIIVSFGSEHIKKTPYGIAVAVGNHQTVYAKDWQMNDSWKSGNLVVFDKKYFNVKKTKYQNPNLYFDDEKTMTWDKMKKIAKMQKFHYWKK